MTKYLAILVLGLSLTANPAFADCKGWIQKTMLRKAQASAKGSSTRIALGTRMVEFKHTGSYNTLIYYTLRFATRYRDVQTTIEHDVLSPHYDVVAAGSVERCTVGSVTLRK